MMRNVRLAILGFLAVLTLAVVFFFDNRELNGLTKDRLYPMMDEPRQHPQALTSKVSELGNGILVTKLYSRNDSSGLYFGMWYRNQDALIEMEDVDWLLEDGEIEFLVKAVDSNGTTYNAETEGIVEGTFSTFRYVQFDDFHYDDTLKNLHVAFYPMKKEEGERTPHHLPLVEADIEIEPNIQ